MSEWRPLMSWYTSTEPRSPPAYPWDRGGFTRNAEPPLRRAYRSKWFGWPAEFCDQTRNPSPPAGNCSHTGVDRRGETRASASAVGTPAATTIPAMARTETPHLAVAPIFPLVQPIRLAPLRDTSPAVSDAPTTALSGALSARRG